MADTLNIFGTTYTGVTGIVATDSTDAEKTYIRPQGTKEITENGTGIDVQKFSTVNVNVQSGATSYNDLSDKPQINSVTLSGNKTLAQLGIAAAADFEEGGDLVQQIQVCVDQQAQTVMAQFQYDCEIKSPMELMQSPLFGDVRLRVTWIYNNHLDSGIARINVDLSNNSVMIYATGLSSYAYGVLGVDRNWKIAAR